MLHILQHSPGQGDSLSIVKTRTQAHDDVLLISDACYYVAQIDALLAVMPDCGTVYVLEPDMQARGLQQDSEQITPIGYDEFVSLTLQHTQTLSW